MVPCDFDESNLVIDKPESMSRDECEPLNVYFGPNTEGHPVIISCWKMTIEEKEEFLKTGRIWVYHWGLSLQPHALTTNHPFERSQDK